MASLDELKRRCFKQNLDPSLKKHYKRSYAIYYALYVTHFFSIRLVWLLQNTPIKPNHVSYLSIIVGLISASLFTCGGVYTALLAAFLFEFNYVLDAVDGQLARARGESSLGGAFLDEWGNFIVPPAIVFALGLRSPWTDSCPWVPYLAAIAVLSISVVELLRFKMEKKNDKSDATQDSSKTTEKISLVKFVYSCLYRSCTMPVIMNLVTIGAIANLIFPWESILLNGLPAYYAIVGTFMWVSKGMYAVKKLS